MLATLWQSRPPRDLDGMTFQEESLESARSPDLQSQEIVIREDLRVVALTSAFADASSIAKEPAP